MFGEFTKDVKLMYVAGLEAIREYQEGNRVKRIAPKIKLLVSPFIPPFLPLEFVSQDMGGIIETYEWDKSRNQSHGNFSIIMQADDVAATKSVTGFPINDLWRSMGASLEDILKPPVLAQLWIKGYHVMTGRLAVRRKSTTKVGSGWKKQYILQFEELGSLYNEHILKSFFNYVSEEFMVINNPAKVLDAGGTLFGFQPLSVSLGLYVYAFIASTLAYGFKGFPTPYLNGSDGLPIGFRLVALPSPLGAISNMSLVTQLVTDSAMFQAGNGSFWDFLKSMIPEPYMELFTESGGRTICTGKLIPSGFSDGSFTTSLTDTVTGTIAGAPVPLPIPGVNVSPLLPGFNYLVCRTSPYDNPLIGISPWHSLIAPFTMGVFDLLTGGDFIIITDDDLVSKDLGVSRKQQFTLFNCNMSGKNASGGSGSGDVNRPSIASGPFLPFFPGGIRSFGHKLFEKAFDSTSLAWGGLVGQSIQRWSRKFTPGINIRSLSTLLNYWFRNASKFREGTIVTREFPYARPGMVLLYLPTPSGKIDDKRDLGIYYIDNVSSSNTIGKGGSTQFSVIRGTPMPQVLSNLLSLLMDWEIIPPGLNLFDGEYP
jgi:hypothetical protein